MTTASRVAAPVADGRGGRPEPATLVSEELRMQVVLPVPTPRDASPAPLRLPELLRDARVPCAFVRERGAGSITCRTLVCSRTFRPVSHASRSDGPAWRPAVAAVEVASTRRAGRGAHPRSFAPALVVTAEAWPRLAVRGAVADPVATLGSGSADPDGVAGEALAPFPAAHRASGRLGRGPVEDRRLTLVHFGAAFVVSDRGCESLRCEEARSFLG
jgi:hypothetical protein